MKIRNTGHFLMREFKYLLYWISNVVPILPSFMFHRGRPKIWRMLGAKLGNDVSIGAGVYLDVDGADKIVIGNHVMIASECLLLCHRRDLSSYSQSDLQVELPYIREGVTIEDNVIVGMRSLLMPGVTIGEGAVIAAGSVVTRSVAPFTIVGGNPAKELKKIIK